ncbi:MAG: PilZ domain-containing protein [Myxococcota bacterium]
MNKRHLYRVQLDHPVEISFGEGFESARCKDLTAGGMFVATAHRPDYGTSVAIRLDLPDHGTVDLTGRVRWSRDGGFGVQFDEPSQDVTYALTAFLHQAAQAANKASQAPNVESEVFRLLEAQLQRHGPDALARALSEFLGNYALQVDIAKAALVERSRRRSEEAESV